MQNNNIDFDPSHYDYLDDKVPLEGWMWEFIRRNEDFKSIFTEVETCFSKKKNRIITYERLSDDEEPEPYLCKLSQAKRGDLHTISRLLGLKDIRMTQRCSHLSVENLGEATSVLDRPKSYNSVTFEGAR